MAATGAAELVSLDEGGRLRWRGSCLRDLGAGAGEGFASSTGGAASADAAGLPILPGLARYDASLYDAAITDWETQRYREFA